MSKPNNQNSILSRRGSPTCLGLVGIATFVFDYIRIDIFQCVWPNKHLTLYMDPTAASSAVGWAMPRKKLHVKTRFPSKWKNKIQIDIIGVLHRKSHEGGPLHTGQLHVTIKQISVTQKSYERAYEDKNLTSGYSVDVYPEITRGPTSFACTPLHQLGGEKQM